MVDQLPICSRHSDRLHEIVAKTSSRTAIVRICRPLQTYLFPFFDPKDLGAQTRVQTRERPALKTLKPKKMSRIL
jgi:hypothetical protein